MSFAASDIDALAEAVASRIGLGVASRGKLSGSPHEANPLDRTGIRKRRRTYGIHTRIRGHQVTIGGFITRTAAEEYLYRLRREPELLTEYLRGKLNPAGPTVKKCVETYMREHGSAVKTADRHRQYQAHLIPALGGDDASTIRQRDVDRYRQIRSGAADKTIHNELCFLRTALRWAWMNDLLDSPPRFVLRTPRCERTRVAYPAEARRLIEASEMGLRRVLLAMWCCGMRRGEIIGARWSWVNTHSRELVLPGSATKTGRERSVVLPGILWDMLQLEPRHPEVLFARVRRGGNGRWGEETVEPWSMSALRRHWEATLEAAGVRGLWLHDLRRSMASVAQELGHAQAAVQLVGGWEDPGVLQRHYSRASRGAQEAVSEGLAKLLLGSDDELAAIGRSPKSANYPEPDSN